jgi:hypothetical protein
LDVDEMGRLDWQANLGVQGVRAEDVFRNANESVAAKARELEFAPDQPLPFLCECSDTHCFAHIMLTIEEYEEARSDSRRYLTISGHGVRGAQAKKL